MREAQNEYRNSGKVHLVEDNCLTTLCGYRILKPSRWKFSPYQQQGWLNHSEANPFSILCARCAKTLKE
jgi:hypothetical protein